MSATDALTVQPLIPLSAKYTTVLDILLPPVLILCSFLLYVVYNNTTPIGHAHVYRMRTSHARFLPKEAQHAFSYQTVFFGLDVQELESKRLDWGRLFKWDSRVWSIFSIAAADYLNKAILGKSQGIEERLRGALRANGYMEELESIYMVTMPGYFGFHGINPLTVYFGYGRGKAELREMRIVVLEVHNTFHERHLYYLQPGKDEDILKSSSFTHKWTFPRSFHVSPFNDRSGFYEVSLVDPLTPADPRQPYFAVKILLLTAENKEKKLMADLKGHGVPLSESSALSAVVQFPLSLFLTTPRILWQATKLHYKKRLDVFPKPEPFSIQNMDGLHLVNPVQAGGLAGNVLSQSSDKTTQWIKDQLLIYLKIRVEEIATLDKRYIRVRLILADPSEAPIDIQPRQSPPDAVEVLEIVHASSQFFIDLLLAPTSTLALALGMRSERRWVVSDTTLFCSLLDGLIDRPCISNDAREAARIRRAHIKWSMSFCPDTVITAVEQLDLAMSRPHFLDYQEKSLVSTLRTQIFIQKLTYWIFGLTRARFVKGMEPWSEWARAAKHFAAK